MSGKIMHKHYTIYSTRLQTRDSLQWTLSIAISWEHDGKRTVRPFSVETTYLTEAEADRRGIAYGQLIIDGKVPGCSVD